MRPRRGKGANRRGSQSIDRVRAQISVWQSALICKAVERIAGRFEADGGGGRLWARVVRWAWTVWSLNERHWFGPSAAANELSGKAR